MLVGRCTGQDMLFEKPSNIYDVTGLLCWNTAVIFKNELVRICKNCKHEVRNSKQTSGARNGMLMLPYSPTSNAEL